MMEMETGPDLRPIALSRRVVARCLEADFALAGITTARDIDRPEELIRWLDSGRHGEMRWMEQYLDQRIDPREKLEGAQAIICVADRYAHNHPDPTDPLHGRIARYARGGDYHKSMKKRLHGICDELVQQFPDECFVACVDTAPVMERDLALRAGLGYIGKNTMLIEPGVGSYLLLGEIITTLNLAPTGEAMTDHCGSCTACIDACPTEALEPWKIDATRCISYLTIEHRSAIEPDLHAGIGSWIFGCDICQEVCPHNGPTPRTLRAQVNEHYEAVNGRAGFNLLEVLGWTTEDRTIAFQGSALKRARLDMMKRNALIAAGNALGRAADGSGNPMLQPALRQSLVQRLTEIAAGTDQCAECDMVRTTAQHVLERLKYLQRSPGDAQAAH